MKPHRKWLAKWASWGLALGCSLNSLPMVKAQHQPYYGGEDSHSVHVATGNQTGGAAVDEWQDHRLQCGWLADPQTFCLNLKVHYAGGGFRVAGAVPNERVKARALDIAQDLLGSRPMDSMMIVPGMDMRLPLRIPAGELEFRARELLQNQAVDGAQAVQVKADARGRVTLTGRVHSFEDQLSLCRSLRGLAECGCVISHLSVEGSSAPSAANETAPVASTYQFPMPVAPVGTSEPVHHDAAAGAPVQQNFPAMSVYPSPEPPIIKTAAPPAIETQAPPVAPMPAATPKLELPISQPPAPPAAILPPPPPVIPVSQAPKAAQPIIAEAEPSVFATPRPWKVVSAPAVPAVPPVAVSVSQWQPMANPAKVPTAVVSNSKSAMKTGGKPMVTMGTVSFCPVDTSTAKRPAAPPPPVLPPLPTLAQIPGPKMNYFGFDTPVASVSQWQAASSTPLLASQYVSVTTNPVNSPQPRLAESLAPKLADGKTAPSNSAVAVAKAALPEPKKLDLAKVASVKTPEAPPQATTQVAYLPSAPTPAPKEPAKAESLGQSSVPLLVMPGSTAPVVKSAPVSVWTGTSTTLMESTAKPALQPVSSTPLNVAKAGIPVPPSLPPMMVFSSVPPASQVPVKAAAPMAMPKLSLDQIRVLVQKACGNKARNIIVRNLTDAKVEVNLSVATDDLAPEIYDRVVGIREFGPLVVCVKIQVEK